MFDLGRDQSPSQGEGRIVLGSGRRDRKTKNRPDRGPQSARGLMRPAFLYGAQHRENLCRADLAYGPLIECRHRQAEQPAHFLDGGVGSPLVDKALDILPGDEAERIAGRDLPGPLLDFGLGTGIDTCCERFLRRIPSGPGVPQRDLWIPAERELPLFPIEAVGQSPELATRRSDKKMEAASIRQFERLLRGLGLADSDVCHGIGGALCWHRDLLASANANEHANKFPECQRAPESRREPRIQLS